MMKAGKGSQTAAAVCMAVLGLAAAYGATPLYNGMKNAGKGTAVDISGKNAEAYQVDSVAAAGRRLSGTCIVGRIPEHDTGGSAV